MGLSKLPERVREVKSLKMSYKDKLLKKTRAQKNVQGLD